WVTVSPGGASPGILTLTGTATSLDGVSLALRLNGPDAGTGYDQLRVTGGRISLGSATLQLTRTAAYAPGTGPATPDSPGGVQGTFAGLGQGATVQASGAFFRINYTATGVTLTALAGLGGDTGAGASRAEVAQSFLTSAEYLAAHAAVTGYRYAHAFG